MPLWGKRFWELDSESWRELQRAVATYWLTGSYAARMMATRRSGLIVFVTDNVPGEPSTNRGQILHDLGHESINRLIAGMANDAKKLGIALAG